MLPVFKYHIKINKKTPWSVICKHLLDVLKECNFPMTIRDFHFEGSEHSKNIAINRLLKLNSKFLDYKDNSAKDHDIYTSFANSKKFPLDIESSLIELFPKTGKAFPFHKALYCFSLPFENDSKLKINAANLFRAEIPRNCIVLTNDWWISGRQISVNVCVVPKIVDDELVLPEVFSTFMEKVGKVKKRELLVFKDNEEEKSHDFIQDEHPLISQFEKLANELMAKGKLERNIGDLFDAPRESIPRKKIIAAAIKELGFKPLPKETGFGFLTFQKQTQANNFVRLCCDFGSYAPNCISWLEVIGPLWKYKISLPFVESEPGKNIVTVKEFERSIYNVHCLLPLAEDTIDGLERLHGETPKWFYY